MNWREATDFEHDLLTGAQQDWAAWPSMLDLVRVLTLVPRIEPRLLRNARLRFTPGLSAEAEARLWFSPLVDNRSTQAIVLHQGVARLLAEPMVAGSDDMPPIDVVWEFTREHTRHWSAEDRLERDVRYDALIDNGQGLEKGFRDILRLIHATAEQPAAEGERERVRLSRLAKRTLPAVAQADALPGEGQLLAQYAALALGDAATWAVSAQTKLPDWLRQRLPSPVGAAGLAVTLREDAELGRVVHFLEPAADSPAESEALAFPTPLPARLHIAAEDQPGDWHTVGIDSRVRVPDVAVLVLTTLDGRRWALRSQAQATGAQTEQVSAVERLILSFVEADRESAERIRHWLEGQGLRVDLLAEGTAPPPGDRATARVVRLWTAAAQREWLSRDPTDREALTDSLLLQLDDIDPVAEADIREVQRLDWRDWQRAVDGDTGAPLLEPLRRWLAMPTEAPSGTQTAADAAAEDAAAVDGEREAELAALLRELDDPATSPARRFAIGDRLAELGDPRPGVGVGVREVREIGVATVIPEAIFRTTALVNQRQGPGTEFETLPGGPLPAGTLVMAGEHSGDWHFVIVQADVEGFGGREGWVHSHYLEREEKPTRWAEDQESLSRHSLLVCEHLGEVVLPEGDGPLTEKDLGGAAIVGCPNAGPGLKPCTAILPPDGGLADRHAPDGSRFVLKSVTGLTNGTPPGTVRYRVEIPVRLPLRLAGRILWVDDNPANNDAERRHLERAYGVKFDIAISTEEAIEALNKKPYDAVISDSRRDASSYTPDALSKYLEQASLIVYTSQKTGREYGQILRDHGAASVTSSQAELYRLVARVLSSVGTSPDTKHR
jgi:CheY-like chemotaxis protein